MDEETRAALYTAYEQGWDDGAGWPQEHDNPYKKKE